MTFGNTTRHEYDHDSEFEFDEGDDKSLKTPEKLLMTTTAGPGSGKYYGGDQSW